MIWQTDTQPDTRTAVFVKVAPQLKNGPTRAVVYEANLSRRTGEQADRTTYWVRLTLWLKIIGWTNKPDEMFITLNNNLLCWNKNVDADDGICSQHEWMQFLMSKLVKYDFQRFYSCINPTFIFWIFHTKTRWFNICQSGLLGKVKKKKKKILPDLPCFVDDGFCWSMPIDSSTGIQYCKCIYDKTGRSVHYYAIQYYIHT